MAIKRTNTNSSQVIAARVDDRGRLTIPKEIREALDIREGDTCFFNFGENYFRVVRGENPFQILEQDALEQDGRGETVSFDVALEELANIDPDNLEFQETDTASTGRGRRTPDPKILEVQEVMQEEYEEMMRRVSAILEKHASGSDNLPHE